MTGMHRLQLFQAIVVIVGIGIMLMQCLALIGELRKYKGYSVRTGRHNLYRIYQLVLKPLGLTITFTVVYFGLKLMYTQTFDHSNVVMYDVWPSLYFGIAAFCICFQLYALIERLVLKAKLKDEYLDYVFWDIDIKPHMDRPLGYNESKKEQHGLSKRLHYTRIGISVILGVMFIAAGVESMNFYRAICSDQIYEARCDQPDVILRYKDIASIEPMLGEEDYFVVYGKDGQQVNMRNDYMLQYVSKQSGISMPIPE